MCDDAAGIIEQEGDARFAKPLLAQHRLGFTNQNIACNTPTRSLPIRIRTV